MRRLREPQTWIGLIIGAVVLLAVGFVAVDFVVSRAEARARFEVSCVQASDVVGIGLTYFHCQCIYDDLRESFSVAELDGFVLGVGRLDLRPNSEFSDRFASAYFGCR